MASLAAYGAQGAALCLPRARSECRNSSLSSACALRGQPQSATWRLQKRPTGGRSARRATGSGRSTTRSVLTEPPPEQKEKAGEKGSSTGGSGGSPSPDSQEGTWLDSVSNAFTELLSSGSAAGVPIAKGNLSDLVARPLFYFLYDSFIKYGSVFKLEFGPKAFIIVSDPVVARHILKENSFAYDKGVLAEILEPIMGKGLIPADLETWRERRRAIVPAFHSAYLDAMVHMFSRCGKQSVAKLNSLVSAAAPPASGPRFARVEMEAEFSSLALDIIGLAVFNFEFGSVSTKSPVIEAVYGTLAEAEHRSTFYFPYWKIPFASCIVPRQRKFQTDLKLINQCLDDLISRALATRQEDDLEALQQRDYSNVKDASVLRFLVDMRGEDCSSRQLRDDLMTMLIAGHETTAAVLTWATFKLAQDAELQRKVQAEVDSVLGGRQDVTWEDVKKMQLLRLTVSESLRMYPQPPLLIRRSLQPDTWPAGFSGVENGISISKGTDIFIAIYNIHRSPQLWDDPDTFNPERFLKIKAGAPELGWDGYEPERLQGGLYPNEVVSDFAFLPFGGGTRKCVGDQFAVMESVVGLALLLQEFDVRLSGSPEDVQLVTGATIHTKDGLWCNVSRREGK